MEFDLMTRRKITQKFAQSYQKAQGGFLLHSGVGLIELATTSRRKIHEGSTNIKNGIDFKVIDNLIMARLGLGVLNRR